MHQMDGKSSIPSELAEFDITNAVVTFDTEPFAAGLYFDIYHGAWKLDTHCTIHRLSRGRSWTLRTRT